MITKEKEKLKKVISEKINELNKNIKTFQNLSKPVSPDNAIGRITRMEAINSKSINEASLQKSKRRLKQLENSLKMIDSPDFGLCLDCEEPIPYKRLLILPETSYCVACAEERSE